MLSALFETDEVLTQRLKIMPQQFEKKWLPGLKQ